MWFLPYGMNVPAVFGECYTWQVALQYLYDELEKSKTGLQLSEKDDKIDLTEIENQIQSLQEQINQLTNKED